MPVQAEIDASLALMRVMFGVAVVGAGIVGLTTLFAPRLAAQYVFAGSVEVGPYLRILGALWLALGTAAAFGLADPVKFSPILFVQFVYKSAWMLAVAVPAIVGGNRDPGLLFLAGLFAVWAVVLAFAVPFRYLLGGG